MPVQKIRDGEATREKVLGTAEKLFAEGGFAGTSIRKISKASGVSDGLILHHFKTKERLYSSVKERLARQYADALKENLVQTPDIQQMIRGTMETAYHYFKENDHYRRISLWSYLEGRQDIAETELGITLKMIEMVDAAQKAKVLREDIEPFLFPVLVKGAVDFWIRWKHLMAEALKRDEDDEKLDQLFFEQLFELITRK